MRNLLEKQRLKIARYRRVRLPHRISHFKQASRHPRMVPVITFAVLLILSVSAYFIARTTDKLPPVHDAKIVIISHDKQQQVVPTKESTVGQLLQKLSIKLNEGDVVEPAAATPIDQDQFRINIYRAVPLQVVDGGKSIFAYSAAKTPRSIAQQAGTSLYPEDIVTTEPVQDFLRSGSLTEQVVVDRAVPVNVDLYGTKVVLRTHAKTVAGLMKEKNIKLIKDDKVVPALGTPITPGQQLSFIRTGVKVETLTEDIAMPIRTINDATLAYGTSAIRQQGSPGQQISTYKVSIVNNVETGRQLMQKIVTRDPVEQIMVLGTSLSGIKGDMALAGIAPGDYQYADYIITRESGWCPTKAQGQWGGCPPYTGSVPSYGGYGLCQSTPGSKMASAGADWATNPVTQLRWCHGYAMGRYGSWGAAYSYWLAHHNW